MSYLIVIPARAASTRLPDKPLADIAGLPMVVRVAQQAQLTQAARVVVATDDLRVQAAVREHGIDVLLTRADHPTGTDRIGEVVDHLKLADEDIVVNVQGDEPLIEPAAIDAVAQQLQADEGAAIATSACAIHTDDDLRNPNIVKVVCTQQGRALYFSRAPIPWARDAATAGLATLTPGLPAWRHIGLYAYRAGFLRQYPQLPRGPLERFESLEQLRALEHGFGISVTFDDHPPMPGVDTPADLEKVRALFASRR